MGRFNDVFTAPAIAAVWSEAGSNKIPYLGAGFFPVRQKSGLELKWIKGSKGLPVTLMPSAFDSVAPIRSRQGLEVIDTEMAYFKEAMLIKEQDIQDYDTILEDSPKAREILDRNFDDASTLIDGADVVAERMRMMLLANASGTPTISISVSGGATYSYNYDPKGTYVSNNFTELQGNSLWSDLDDSDPLKDVSDAQDAIEASTGNRPSILLMSKATMNLLKQNVKIKGAILAQNATANILMTDNRVKELFSAELGIDIIVYSKQYKDESGNTKKFYPDGMVTLLPAGTLGTTWKGVTPEERTLMGSGNANVVVVDNGTAVTVTVSDDPVQTKTKVSEIVLPSFERMDETYMIKVDTNVTY